MRRFPNEIVIHKHQYPQQKGDDGQVLIGISAEKGPGVEPKKFADHPVSVGTDPKHDGHIMANFAHQLAGSNGDNDGYDQGREYHQYPQGFPDHTPTDVFEKPENDMQVLHLAETHRDTVHRGMMRHKNRL